MKSLFVLLLCSILFCVVYTANPNIGEPFNINFITYPQYYNSSLVFLLDDNNNVAQSNDGGFTWGVIPNVTADTILLNLNSQLVLFFMEPTLQTSNITTYSVYNVINNSISVVTQPGLLQSLSQNPSLSDQLTCISYLNETYSALVSLDFGITWTLVFDEETAISGIPTWNSLNSGGGLYIVLFNDTTGADYLVFTLDFQNKITILDNVAQFVNTNFLHYWALTTDGEVFIIASQVAQPVVLYDQSGDILTGPWNAFVILDDSDYNGVFLAAEKDGNLTQIFQYASDDGIFTQSFNGVYNQKISGKQYLVDFTNFHAPGFYALNQQTSVGNYSVQTFFTIDDGNTWNNFQNDQGQQINFYGDVSFVVNQIAPLYASPFSVGYTIGNGVVGDYLNLNSSTSDNSTQTYISRDSGSTWTSIYQGETMYEFGNFGNFLIFAPVPNPNNILFYTMDQGLTISNITLPDQVQDLQLFNIFYNHQEQGSTTLLFTLFFNYPSNGTGLILSVDFTPLAYPECQFEWVNGTLQGDFELVNVHGNFSLPNTTCVDGGELEYFRRKQTSQCIVLQAPYSNTTTSCACTEDDFECDINFHPTPGATSLNCTINKGQPLPSNSTIPATCSPGSYYSVSKGYKRIFGDTCIGGVSPNYDPDFYPCPGSNSESSDSQVTGSSQFTGNNNPVTTGSNTGSNSGLNTGSNPIISTGSNPISGGNSGSNPISGGNSGSNPISGGNSGSNPVITSGNTGSNSFTSGSLDGGTGSNSGSNTGLNTGSNTGLNTGSNTGLNTGSNSGSFDTSGSASAPQGSSHQETNSEHEAKHDHKGVVIGVLISSIVVVCLVVFIMVRFPNIRVRIGKLFRGNEYTYSKLTQDSDYLIYEDTEHDNEDI